MSDAGVERSYEGRPEGVTEADGGRYIEPIDGLRAISVLSVVSYHLDETLLPGGFTGVDVFFVISGFVVTKSIFSRREESFARFLTSFYRRRALRIAPALVLFLMVTGVLSTLFVPSAFLSRTNDVTGIAAFFGVSNLSLWWFSGDYFSPTTDFNPFTHTWSLSVEEQFYLVFPFLAFFLLRPNGSRASSGLMLALCALSLASSAALTRSDQSFAFYMLPTRFWELGVGASLFLGLDAIGGRAGRRLARTPPVLVGGLTLLSACGLLASLSWADEARFPFPWALAPVLSAAALIGLVTLRPDALGARLLSTPVLTFFGRISYGLYLWHFGVIVLFRWTIGLEAVWQKLLAAALGVALAWASHRFLEVPVRHGRRLALRSDAYVLSRAAAAVVAACLLTGSAYLARPAISLSATVDDAVWSPRGEDVLVRGDCEVARLEESAPMGRSVRFVPEGCGADPGRRLAVVGDSHAGAYETMLQHVAAREGTPVDVHVMPGCQPFRFREDPEGARDAGCGGFRESVVEDLEATLSEGDVLLLAGLRVTRFRDQGGERIRENADLDLSPVPGDLAEAAAAFEVLEPLIRAGVRVVVEAPKPIFPAAPFRCADWFTRTNPHCAPGFETTRREMEERRARVLASMRAFAAMDPAITVWDPLPRLCPEEVCSAFLDGEPLFVDGDHLSRRGNLFALPAFVDHLDGLGGEGPPVQARLGAGIPGEDVLDAVD